MGKLRYISTDFISGKVKELFHKASFTLPEKIINDLKKALKSEVSPLGLSCLKKILLNAKLAPEIKIPLCQDTGTAQVIIEIGQNVVISGGNLNEAINCGVAEAYQEFFLRKSIVRPINRDNLGNNCPAIIEHNIISGDKLTIICLPKGGGCDNMGQVEMLSPAVSYQGIIDSVLKAVKKAASNPCPPIYLGVAVGGTFDSVAQLAKKALLSNIKPFKNLTAQEQEISEELYTQINNLGLGPAGLGGLNTTLGVVSHLHPCHMASLPVAVNISCHSFRLAWETV